MSVVMDDLVVHGCHAEYHWTLTGLNAAQGGIGHRVRISGREEWRIGDDGLIASSQGQFDAAEFVRRKLSSAEPAPGRARRRRSLPPPPARPGEADIPTPAACHRYIPRYGPSRNKG